MTDSSGTGTMTSEPPSAAHALLQDDHTSAWMGIHVLEVGPGRAVISMELREEMLNGFGIAHGGMVFAFADTAFALACNDAAGDEETMTVASGGDISFLRSAHRGQFLTAVAVHRASAGRSGVYDVTVTATGATTAGDADDGGSVLIAEFRGRSRTIPRPTRRTRGRTDPSPSPR